MEVNGINQETLTEVLVLKEQQEQVLRVLPVPMVRMVLKEQQGLMVPMVLKEQQVLLVTMVLKEQLGLTEQFILQISGK